MGTRVLSMLKVRGLFGLKRRIALGGICDAKL
jgi:hypothetical protein